MGLARRQHMAGLLDDVSIIGAEFWTPLVVRHGWSKIWRERYLERCMSTRQDLTTGRRRCVPRRLCFGRLLFLKCIYPHLRVLELLTPVATSCCFKHTHYHMAGCMIVSGIYMTLLVLHAATQHVPSPPAWCYPYLHQCAPPTVMPHICFGPIPGCRCSARCNAAAAGATAAA
jgi:hypothetical protein